MTGGDRDSRRSLEQTPTWAVAAVCFVFIIISILIERTIHHAGKWLQRRDEKALYNALEKIKSELMVLGFLSVLLTIGQTPVSRICISDSIAKTMLPCKSRHPREVDRVSAGHRNRNLLGELQRHVTFSVTAEEMQPGRRLLGSQGGIDNHCADKGMAALVTQNGIHQLHIFIFILAVVHVLYSILTMSLGRARMRAWKAWEEETTTEEDRFSHSRLRYAKETTFAKRHVSSCTEKPMLVWIACFFRQFFMSVPKVDYLTLRYSFIQAHLGPHCNKFNFHRYIKRSLEDDFKVVVGISPPLWIFAVIFLLLNVYGWYTYMWLSFVPLIIILIVGTKLQLVITAMALEIRDNDNVIEGNPTVRPSDELFWFRRPGWVLFLIHFSLFQNAFQLAFLVWTWYEFGISTCFHDYRHLVVIRIIAGMGALFLCSYLTLPLYALVTQMGSHMKKAIFEEQTANALERWQQCTAKNRKNLRKPRLLFGFRRERSTPTGGCPPTLHPSRQDKITGDLQREEQSEGEISEMAMYAASSLPPAASTHLECITLWNDNSS